MDVNKIITIAREHPKWNPAHVAREAGCSPQPAATVMKSEGLLPDKYKCVFA